MVMKARYQEAIYLILCIISAITIRFVFAPYHLHICVIPALVVLFFVVGKSKYPFICGFVYGCTKAIAISFWLLDTLTSHYGLSWLIAMFFYSIAIVIPYGIWVGIFCKCIKNPITLLCKSKDVSKIIALSLLTASILTTLEWIRINISPENSWGFLPTAFSNIPELMELAAYIGGIGLHFIVVFLCSILICAVQNINNQTILLKTSAIAILIVFASFITGGMLLSNLNNSEGTEGQIIEIVLIHPVISQKQRWNSAFDQQILATYRQMSLQAFDDNHSENTRLIIWPETAITAGVQDSALTKAVISEITKKTGAWLLTGSPAFIGKGQERKIYNSAFLYSPDGEIKGRYDKNFLLPFAERKYALFSLGGYQQSQTYENGKYATPISFIDKGKKISLATMICYEIGIPQLSHDIISQQSSLIVNISNDAWFGNSSESEQQLDMLILRSAEYGLPAIRSTGYGVAALIANARVITKSDIDNKSIIKGTINLQPYQPTLWAQIPNWPIIITAGVVLIYIFMRVFRICPSYLVCTEE